MTLLELLKQNNNYASKSGQGIGTDKEFIYDHHYVSSFYDEHFIKYKDKPINLLEIGVQYGGSLLLWNDYFQNGTIYGVDIEDKTDPIINTFPRIKRTIGNAYDDNIASTLPEFDIVIDDGPHTLNSFEACLRIYLPKVRQGGVLVIEDIPDLEYIKYLRVLTEGYEDKVVDTRSQYGRFDNIMYAVFK